MLYICRYTYSTCIVCVIVFVIFSLEKYKENKSKADKSGVSKDVDRRRQALKTLLQQEQQVYEVRMKK